METILHFLRGTDSISLDTSELRATERPRPIVKSSFQVIFICLGFIILFSPLVEGGTTQFPVLVIRLVLLGALVVWLLDQMGRGSLFLLRNSVGPPLITFLVWGGLTLLWAPYKAMSAQWFLNLLFYAFLFGITLKSVPSGSHIRVLVTLLLGMGVVEGSAGIIQYLWLDEARARGTFFNPNFFAAYEGATLTLSLGLALGIYRTEHTPGVRKLLWGTVVVSGSSFVMAQSRGALVAVIAVLFLFGLLRFGKRAVVVLLACTLIGVLVPNPLRQRIIEAPSQDPYAYTRLEIWKSSLNRFIEQPLGIGLGMYKYGSFQYRFPIDDHIVRYRKRAESAHNEYLQMGVELGIVGLAIFLVGLGIWLREAWLIWQSPSQQIERDLVLGLTGAALVLLVHAGMDSVFHEPALMVFLVVACALIHSLYMRSHPTELRWLQVPFQYSRARAGLVLAAALTLSAFCIQPAAAWYAHELGKRESSQGRTAKAMERYGQATAIDPGTTGYHDSVARTAIELYQESRDTRWLVTASEEEYLARDLNRLDGRFPYRLGTIYVLMAGLDEFRQGRSELLNQATVAFTEAIHTDPFSPFSYLELAKLHLSQGRDDEAIALLKTARGYEPNFLPGRALLAEVSLKKGVPGDYKQEMADIAALHSQYAQLVRDDVEQQFINVDLYPLGRAVALDSKP